MTPIADKLDCLRRLLDDDELFAELMQRNSTTKELAELLGVTAKEEGWIETYKEAWTEIYKEAEQEQGKPMNRPNAMKLARFFAAEGLDVSAFQVTLKAATVDEDEQFYSFAELLNKFLYADTSTNKEVKADPFDAFMQSLITPPVVQAKESGWVTGPGNQGGNVLDSLFSNFK